MLVVCGACYSRFPLTKDDEVTTTYAAGFEARVIPPRAARAQKVVFDDPKAQLIHERDTPLRRFFSTRTRDFAPGELDYAKTTILEDVLARLESRSYVHRMIQEIVARHAGIVGSECLAAASTEPRTAEEISAAARAKAVAERRASMLTDALHALFTHLEYPYVDDQDIDSILSRVTGFTEAGWKPGTAVTHWPFGEAHEAWRTCVTDPRERPCDERYDLVADFVRDLHLTLHRREFFRDVIRDAASKRSSLFASSGLGAPALVTAKQQFRRFLEDRLDAALRKKAVTSKASPWAAFLETSFTAEGEKGPSLKRPAQAVVTVDEFTRTLRSAVVDAAKQTGKEKLSADDLAALFRDELAANWRAWLVAATPQGASGTAPELAPLRDAAATDPAANRAFQELVEQAKVPLANARTALSQARAALQQIGAVTSGGTTTTPTDEQVVAAVRSASAPVERSVASLRLADWHQHVSEDAGSVAGKLLAKWGAAGDKAKFEAAARTLRASIVALEGDRRFQALRAATDDATRLRALHAGNPFDKNVEPLSALLAAAKDFVDEAAAMTAAAGADPSAVEAFRAQRDFLSQQRAALERLHTETRDAALAAAAATLGARDAARGAIRDAEQRFTAEGVRTTAQMSAWLATVEPVMQKANADLAPLRRQDVAALLPMARAAAAPWLAPVLSERGKWPEDPKYEKSETVLAELFRSGGRDDVKDALEHLVARFRRVFGADVALLGENADMLTAFVRTADLGAATREATDTLRRVLPAQIETAIGDKGELLVADGAGALLVLLDGVLASPAISYLFARPGSTSAQTAFETEFFEAFHHRLGEAVKAERAADYDYWWLTFYPKAVPINGQSFRSESVLDVAFPQQVTPQETFHRWLQDREPSEEEIAERFDRMVAVMTAFRSALDSPGLAGQHDGARRLVLDVLRTLTEPRARTKGHDDLLDSVMLRITARMQRLPRLSTDRRKLDFARIQCWICDLDALARSPSVCARKKLREKLQASSMPTWYLDEVSHGSPSQLQDLADLGKYLIGIERPECMDALRDHAPGAARALARAPFGTEHILFTAIAAYASEAMLPTIVDVVTNAFFDGVGRFEALSAAADGDAKKQLVDFLRRSEVSSVPNGCTPGPSLGDLLDQVIAAQPTDTVTERGDPGSQFLASSIGSRTAPLPAITRPNSIATDLGRLCAATTLRPEVVSPRNPYLHRPQLWDLERWAAVARGDLRRFLVHAFQARYPDVPTADEVEAEFSRDTANVEAFLYVLLRDAWVVTEQERLLAAEPVDTSEQRERRFRNLLCQLLTSNDLLPPGVAHDVVGEIHRRCRVPDPSCAAVETVSRWFGRAAALPHNNPLTWIAAFQTSPTAMQHLRKKLVWHLHPGLWAALADLSETRFRSIDFTRVTQRDYETFLGLTQPALQPGVQIVELLPSSRDDLVSMAINEGGVIAQVAAYVEGEATYDVNQVRQAERDARKTLEVKDDPAPKDRTAGGTEDRSFLEELSRKSEALENVGYGASANVAASVYGRYKSAYAYARRREYLDAAITAAGRGDRRAQWVIRPSDLRSDLAGTDGRKMVAAAHSGYPNGDQPFHMLVKVPHDAVHKDWRGREYLYFNSAYTATNAASMTDSGGQVGWLGRALLFLVNWPWIDAVEERVVGTKFPFQWDVDSAPRQAGLLEAENRLGGRIQLDSTDKINFSEVDRLIQAEAGFLRLTRSAQSASLQRVMQELETERAAKAREAREKRNPPPPGAGNP